MADEKPEPQETQAVEYEEIVTMDMMFPGKVNWWEATPDMLRELAESYDPSFLRAPIVADHRQEGPAFGHVLSVEFIEGETDTDDFTLRAEVGLFESGKYMIESGGWNERSVFIDDHYPMPGIFYLRHLSLLGAANPAIPGMSLVVLPPLEDADEATEEEASKIPGGYRGMVATAMLAVWDKSDEYIRYRVRPVSRFKDDTFRTVTLSKKGGIFAVQGKLKGKFVPKGRKPGSMVNQSLLFSREKDWDLEKAKKWVAGKQKTLAAWLEEDEEAVPSWVGVVMGQHEVNADDIEITIGRESAGVDPAVQDTLKTAKADGGKSVMPNEEKEGTLAVEEKTETIAEIKAAAVDVKTADPEIQILHESESVEHLREQNRKLLKRNNEIAETARVAEKKLRDRLVSEHSATRQTIIENLVDGLLADGYITHGQKNHGLASALNHIPDEAVVEIDEIEISAIDAVLDCLKMGGKLKLKGEFASEAKTRPAHVSSRVEKLATAKSKVVGLEIMNRIDELRADPENKLGYIAAYEQAHREAGGGE